MNAVMIRKQARSLRWTVLWYALGLVIYGTLIMLYYPTVREGGAAIQDYLKQFPESLIRAFGIADITSLPGFLGAEFLNVIWPIIVAILVIMSGAALVAQEVERGTAEYWLSVPASRASLLTSKLTALFGAMLVLVVVTLLTLVAGAALVDESIAPRNLLALGVTLAAFCVAVGGYAALFSAFASERAKPAGIAAGLTLGFYLLWVLSGLSEGWRWLRYLSIFTAYQPQQALQSGSVPLEGTLILLLIGLACAAGSVVVFRRRDVLA